MLFLSKDKIVVVCLYLDLQCFFSANGRENSVDHIAETFASAVSNGAAHLYPITSGIDCPGT